MRKIKCFFKKNKRLRRKYFTEMRTNISRTNIHLLSVVIFSAIIFVGIFLAISPLLLERFTMTLSHVIGIPVSLCYLVVALILARKQIYNYYFVNILCCSYLLFIGLFIIGIDVVIYPHEISSLMPIIITIVPALFILDISWIHSLILIMEIQYVVALFIFKDHNIAEADLFNSLVGVACSILIASMMVRLRCRENADMLVYRRRSRTDALTGILNKKTAMDSIDTFINSKTHRSKSAFLIIDIDNFKHINDRLGHQFGDYVLGQMGTLLTNLFGNDDIIGRFGGDEFIIFIKEIKDESIIEERCQNIVNELRDIQHGYDRAKITCSVGVGITNKVHSRCEEIFKIADKALYQAKSSGKDCFYIINA